MTSPAATQATKISAWVQIFNVLVSLLNLTQSRVKHSNFIVMKLQFFSTNCQCKRNALNLRRDNNSARFSEKDQLGNSVRETKAGFYLKSALFLNYCNSSSFYLRVRTESILFGL